MFSGCLALISSTLHWSEGHSGSLLVCPLDLQLMQNMLRLVRVGTIVDLETRNRRLRVLLIDGTSRMIDD